MKKIFTFLVITSFICSIHSQNTIQNSSHFSVIDISTNTGKTYTRLLTLTTTDDGNSSKEAQSFQINITKLPENGAYYRISKSNANGSGFLSDPIDLALGLNSKTIAAVTFDINRYVKIQFSSADIEFDALTVNGDALNVSNQLGGSNLFDDMTNNNNAFTRQISLAKISDGSSSQGLQKLDINITDLPEGGANYRVYKTNASGNDFFGPSTALTLGENTISVSAVSFNRAVKIQFSKTDIKFNAISVNDITLESDNIIESNFEIFPNPASDKISIIGIENIKSVKIFNSLGALVKHTKNATNIDVSELSRGVHFLQVDNGNLMTRKFMKK